MNKNTEKVVSIILATLLLSPGLHAAASNSTSSNSLLTCNMHETSMCRDAQRDAARKEFFKQLNIIRENQPEITNPKRIILTAVEQMPTKNEAEERPLRDFLGLSVQDLIDHELVPMIQNDVWGTSIWLEYMFIDDLTGIKNIPGIQDITSLRLSDNRITSLAGYTFTGFTDLCKLYLQYNPLVTVSSHAFAGLNKLFLLSLSNNQLKSIDDPDMFAGLPNVHDLHLNHNQIQTFNPKVIAALPQLNKLILYYNELSSENITQIEKELKAMNKELTFLFTKPQLTSSASALTNDIQTSKRDREEISEGSELTSCSEKKTRTAHSL